MKEVLISNFNNLSNRTIDYIFNNLMTISTLIGIIGFYIQIFQPEYMNDYNAFINTYMIHLRNNNT